MSETEGGRQQARFRVTGRVQGVAFRAQAQATARRLRLSGWIANRRDGSVSGMACGDGDALKAFRSWLQDGPPAATVDALDWEARPTGDDASEGGDFSVAPDLP